MQAQLARAPFQEHAGGLHRERRHRIRARARRIERIDTSQARHADLPLDLGVVRLEIGVRDRPVIEASAGNGAEHAALDEIDLVKAPVVRRVVEARPAHCPSVPEGWLEFLELSLLRGSITKCLRVPDRIVGDAAQVPVLELIVLDGPGKYAWPLFQQHHRESRPRQLARNDSASRAGTDDDEVDGFRVPIPGCAHCAFAGATPNPG